MKPTKQQKHAFTSHVVDVAIIQAAEQSGLRKWLIERALTFTDWQSPNAAEKMLQGFHDLSTAFGDIVPPDERDHDNPFSLSTWKYQEPEMPWMIR